MEKKLNQSGNSFIKTSEQPLSILTSEQKAKLNRRGNELYNENKIEAAERIFVTTGYSDGLIRVGDYYVKRNEKLKALKCYHLAHNKPKEDMILDELAAVIRLFL